MSDWNDLQHRLDNAREIVQKEKGILLNWYNAHKTPVLVGLGVAAVLLIWALA